MYGALPRDTTKAGDEPGFDNVLWRACGDSNARPSAPEADTLSAELQAQTEPQKAKPILPSKEDGVKAEKIVCAKPQRSLEPSLNPPADAQVFHLFSMRFLTLQGGGAVKQAAIIDIHRCAPQSWEEALERFLLWKSSEGAAERTTRGHYQAVDLFFRRFPTAWSSACRDCLLRHMAQEGLSPATYNMRLKTFRPFFEFCVNEGVFSSSPAEGLKYRRDEPRVVDHSMDDIKKILDSIGQFTFMSLRDTTLLLFQLDSGCFHAALVAQMYLLQAFFR